jgi:4-hydroxythreonine-4-phosphate dehydrogenase
MGDPAGIGPEVVAKAMVSGVLHRLCRPLVVGSVSVMEQTVKALRLRATVLRVDGHEPMPLTPTVIPVLDPLPKPLGRVRMGVVAGKNGVASVEFIKKAVHLAQIGCVDGIVTAPINKEAINLGGCHYPGHTELLADLTNAKDSGMMILGGPLTIMFVTTHLALREVPKALTPDGILRAIKIADRAMRECFGIAAPRIGVAALNPHAGEHGLFGDEEQTKIQPAVRRARAAGIDASDPLPADTLFGKAARGQYDAVVAMYHDQGLIPLKLVAFGTCVNMTVGLPIIRTSVDHGTAFDIAGKGVAETGSLVEAVKLAARVARVKSKPTILSSVKPQPTR